MKRFDSFLKTVVKSDYGMSIRDVMDTDYGHLMAILQAEDSEAGDADGPDETVMNLGDFIRAL